MYAELIDLLSCHLLDPHEREEMARQVANAPHDTEYNWAGDFQEIAIAAALADQLADFVAWADNIESTHEQIQDMFDRDFPDFPKELTGEEHGVALYFAWLDKELSKMAVEEGGYDVVELDTGADDNLRLLVVFRKDVARILELATALNLGIHRPKGDQ
ncbi:DUF6630 family protein [Massilia sp. TN1-12]|uniref:DUF6630 family protein n=1 Tax=Massilia paldalensis TaxID=3377675 RepID=UPI00384C601C